MYIYMTAVSLSLISRTTILLNSCADPERCVRGGPTQPCQRFFFLLMRKERTQIPLKAGHHRPASETPGLVAL